MFSFVERDAILRLNNPSRRGVVSEQTSLNLRNGIQPMVVIGGETKLLAVIGDPVRHSLSPLIQNAAIARLGLNWLYLALPVPAEALPAAIRGLHAVGAVGVNVTIPHKQSVIPLLSAITPVAQRLQSVNTLYRLGNGQWGGTNTDLAGFIAPLQQRGLDLAGSNALVLGCGGSARAVVAGCASLGCRHVRVAGRQSEHLQRFLASTAGLADGLTGVHWSNLDAVLPNMQLVVNTTPVGMAPNSEASPLTEQQVQLLRKGCLVLDIIYTPRPTRLLQWAHAHGCTTIDGLAMLVGQGAAALRLWSRREDVDEDTMLAVATEALSPAEENRERRAGSDGLP